MILFHHDVNASLAKHISELERFGFLPKDWAWQSDKVSKLEQIDKRYRDLEQQIATPEIASDPKQLQKLAQERASIEDVVAKYREYKRAAKSLEEVKAMRIEGLDEDMNELV